MMPNGRGAIRGSIVDTVGDRVGDRVGCNFRVVSEPSASDASAAPSFSGSTILSVFVDRITRRAHHPSHLSSASPLERITPRASRRSRRSSSLRFRRRPPTSFVFSMSFSLSFSLSFLLPSFVSSASDRCWTKITTLSLVGIRACAPRACPLRRKFFTRSTIFSSWGSSTASMQSGLNGTRRADSC